MKLVPAKRPITIRDLLDAYGRHLMASRRTLPMTTQQKGLGPPPAQAGIADKAETTCDAIERLGTLPFVAQPGEAWSTATTPTCWAAWLSGSLARPSIA